MSLDDEYRLSPEAFAAVARSLSDAGVVFVAGGHWELQEETWGRPVWDGCFSVPCYPDAVLSAAAALAALGYRSQFPIDPEVYRDPDNLPGPDYSLEDDDPDDISFLSFFHEVSVPAVRLGVEGPDRFKKEHDGARIEEVAPGLSVRIGRFSLADWLDPWLGRYCPQALPDVAVLDLMWKEGLEPTSPSNPAPERQPEGAPPALHVEALRIAVLAAYRALWGKESEQEAIEVGLLKDGAENGRGTEPSPASTARVRPRRFDVRDGIPFDLFVDLVRAMNDTHVRYLLNGAWFVDPNHELGGFWKGVILIPKDTDSASDTFEALARLGYAPRPATSPYELVSWEPWAGGLDAWDAGDAAGEPDSPHGEVDDEDDPHGGRARGGAGGEQGIDAHAGHTRRWTFVSNAHPDAPLCIAACIAEFFESGWEAAEADEVEAGMPVLILNPVDHGVIASDYPQRLREVRARDKLVKQLEANVEPRMRDRSRGDSA